MNVPTHRNEQTGNPALDRIQNNVRAIVEFIRSLLWLTRRAYASLSEDVTAPAAYATLLTAKITTHSAKGFLSVAFTASGARLTNAATTFFQVLIDGKVVKGCQVTAAAAFGFSAAIVVRAPVSAGAHVVEVQWMTDNIVTSRINAASVVTEHAAMSVYEEAT